MSRDVVNASATRGRGGGTVPSYCSRARLARHGSGSAARLGLLSAEMACLLQRPPSPPQRPAPSPRCASPVAPCVPFVRKELAEGRVSGRGAEWGRQARGVVRRVQPGKKNQDECSISHALYGLARACPRWTLSLRRGVLAGSSAPREGPTRSGVRPPVFVIAAGVRGCSDTRARANPRRGQTHGSGVGGPSSEVK